MSPPRPIPDVSPTSAFQRWPGEKNGTVTNSERRISRQRSFRRRRGGESGLVDHRQSGPLWVSRGVCGSIRMTSSASMRRCPVSKTTASGRLISARWLISAVRRGRHAAGALAGQPQRGRSGYHARLAWRWQAADGAGDASTDPGDNRCLYPLILNSGRIRDQWHHDPYRRGAAADAAYRGAMVEVAPQDARYQLPADGLARIWSRHGVMVAKVAISEGQRPARCLFRCTGTTSLPVRGG